MRKAPRRPRRRMGKALARELLAHPEYLEGWADRVQEYILSERPAGGELVLLFVALAREVAHGTRCLASEGEHAQDG